MKRPTEKIIEDSFLKLYIKKNFNKISVKDVCNNANISRATFYTYYEDLECLLREIEDRILYDITEILESWEYTSLERFDYTKPFPAFVKCNKYVLKNINAYKALFGPYANNSFLIKYNQMVKFACYKKWVEEGHDEYESKILTSLSSGAIIDISNNWIFEENRISIEEISLITTKVIGALNRMERL